MPRRTAEVSVSPAVLKWARETAGYPEEIVAQRFRISEDRVWEWETEPGPARLTIRQLEDLAYYYKRPTAALLLGEPPAEPSPPQDFRRPLHRDTPFSHGLRVVMRRAHRLQRLAGEMMEAMKLSSVSDIPRASSREDPEMVARAQREAFGISVQEQLKWRNPYQALRRWRDALENCRVMVFQGDFARQEAQGFSVSNSHPYAVVMTTKDPPTARCFTLFHEFAHLLLRAGGICITEEAHFPGDNDLARTENWCQRFAEAFLVDADALRSRYETDVVIRQGPDYEHALRRLASAFKVSQYVVLFRFWHVGLISEKRFWAEYNRLLQQAQAKVALQKGQREGVRRPTPANQAVAERGRLFARLVLEGLGREMLGYAEATDFLGIPLKHLEEVRRAAYS